MNWYQNQYPPYGYGPPPYGPQCNYIPVPPNTDMDKVLKFVDRITRRKEAEEEKKKKDKKPPPSKSEQTLKMIQWAGFLYITAPFFIILHHYADTLLTQALK